MPMGQWNQGLDRFVTAEEAEQEEHDMAEMMTEYQQEHDWNEQIAETLRGAARSCSWLATIATDEYGRETNQDQARTLSMMARCLTTPRKEIAA